MKQLVAIVLAVLCAVGGAGRALAADSEMPTLSVARITSSIQEGQPWGTVGRGLLCVYPVHLNWNTGIGKLNVRAFEQPARMELKKLGFSIAGDATDPFADRNTGDLAIGGTIKVVQGEFCVAGNYFDQTAVKGSVSIQVDWQLYSTLERKTVWRSQIGGSAKTNVSKEGGFESLLIEAVNDSLDKFVATEDFKRLASARLSTSAQPRTAERNKTAITLTGSSKAGTAKISDAVGAVVLVLSGGGHGSGFLVSTDGYLMTAEHVVGADKYVKIRWSDGLEGVGEVIRTDKRRDVALIKTDPRGRQPLALRRESPQPGDSVFAIGAPLDERNQSTVTRGVASANRILDGFSFIQSDVTISPGNSGGPLLDEQGRVLGICDLTYRPAGVDVPTGINYFIPIDDALRFLSAEPQ
jgi:S1-C subfamily serine protease